MKKLPTAANPWLLQATTTVFDNPWIRVEDHAVTRPDGLPGKYGVVRVKNLAIGILAVDDHLRVPLVGQHRYTLDAYSWEIPEGGCPLGETALAAAARELEEETGFRASCYHELLQLDVSNCITDEQAIIFLATGLSAGKPKPDPTEALLQSTIHFDELRQRAMAGEIRDAMSLAAIFKFGLLLETHGSVAAVQAALDPQLA